MKKNKLSTYLSLLSIKDFEALQTFLKWSKGKEVLVTRLGQIILEYVKKQKGKSIEESLQALKEKNIWKKLFPEKSYLAKGNEVPKKLSNLYLALANEIPRFLSFYTFQQDEIAQQLALLNWLNQKGNADDFAKISSGIENLLSQCNQNSLDYWKYKAQFHREQERYYINQSLKGFGRSKHQMLHREASEYEYLYQQLPYLVSSLNRSKYFNLAMARGKSVTLDNTLILDFEVNLKTFIQYFRERIKNIPKSLISLHLYYWAVELYEHKNAEWYFDQLTNAFEEYQPVLSNFDTANIRYILLNYITKRISNKLSDAQLMYQKMREKKWLYKQDGTIHFQVYMNFCITLLRNQSVMPAFAFIEEYKEYLDSTHKKDVYCYCYGLCCFYNGQFDEALESSNKIGSSNHFCEMGRYTLEVRCYYELNKYELFESCATNGYRYFLQLKSLADVEKREYLDFFLLLKRIGTVFPHETRKVQKIQQEIEAKEPLHQQWLINKLRQKTNG